MSKTASSRRLLGPEWKLPDLEVPGLVLSGHPFAENLLQRLHPDMGVTSQIFPENLGEQRPWLQRELFFQGNMCRMFYIRASPCSIVSWLIILQLLLVVSDRAGEPCTLYSLYSDEHLASRAAGHGQACVPAGAEQLQPAAYVALCRSRR